jgi:hypothetical protein
MTVFISPGVSYRITWATTVGAASEDDRDEEARVPEARVQATLGLEAKPPDSGEKGIASGFGGQVRCHR